MVCVDRVVKNASRTIEVKPAQSDPVAQDAPKVKADDGVKRNRKKED